ncbi:hypothetical protein [Gemmiger formicilis]|uniref:hypothetical protein n=1 Tax=Gemmiger formicilis TaxID=745368 RepID=UPI00204FC578|nr:MAG TPA: major capsid protein [Caudoviricetes sp.]
MPVMINAQNVDERYSPILEPNLFYGSIFVPDATYTDKYQTGPAGGIYVHKLATSAVTPGKPGRDFQDEDTKDELIPILLNNSFQKSKKIYNVQAAQVGIALGNENLSLAINECKEGRQISGIACLVNEGTAATATTAVDNPKEDAVDTRAELTKAKGAADVVLCSPDYYAKILKIAGSEFTPNTNERIALTGRVGQWLGMTFIECGALAEESGKYYDSTGTLKTVEFDGIDYIMYNHLALSIIDSFECARLRDAENFVGTKAQVEMNTGFRVTNKALVRVRKHTA